jgi:hypothetical protein
LAPEFLLSADLTGLVSVEEASVNPAGVFIGLSALL